jgi:glycosyltransferase involved in cell wall biosynthesis
MTTRVCLVGLIAGGHSGVPRYAVKLVQGLDEVAGEYPDVDLQLLTTPEGAAETSTRTIETTTTFARGRSVNAGPGRLLLEQVSARRAGADLLHFFDTTGPILSPRSPFVTTVHDASLYRGFRRSKNFYKHLIYPWALEHARAVVAISQSAKDDIGTFVPVDPEKIKVVHSGPGLSPRHDAPAVDADRGRALLYVGAIGTNKNLPVLVRAFNELDPDLGARLVIAGRPGDGFDAVSSAISEGAARDRIELRTNASDDDIEHLYATSAALFLPSTYEGFGFTPLEAMARGCPVVESDIPSLREISGDGALLVRPDDQAGWRDAMRRVLTDPDLAARLQERGSATVARYSWTATARGVLEVLRSTAATLRP